MNLKKIEYENNSLYDVNKMNIFRIIVKGGIKMSNQIEELKNKIIKETKSLFRWENEPNVAIKVMRKRSINREIKQIDLIKNKEVIISFTPFSEQFYIKEGVLYDRAFSVYPECDRTYLQETLQGIAILKDFVSLVNLLVPHKKTVFTIKELRKQNGITQQQLADRLGTNLRTVQNWENKGIGSTMTRKLISMFFNVPEPCIDFEPCEEENDFRNKIIFNDFNTYVSEHLKSWLSSFKKILIIKDDKINFSIPVNESKIEIINLDKLEHKRVQDAYDFLDKHSKETLIITTVKAYRHLQSGWFDPLFERNKTVLLSSEDNLDDELLNLEAPEIIRAN